MRGSCRHRGSRRGNPRRSSRPRHLDAFEHDGARAPRRAGDGGRREARIGMAVERASRSRRPPSATERGSGHAAHCRRGSRDRAHRASRRVHGSRGRAASSSLKATRTCPVGRNSTSSPISSGSRPQISRERLASGKLGQEAALPAHIAEIRAARMLADEIALEEDDRAATLRKKEGGRGAHQAAADDHHIGASRAHAAGSVASGSGLTGAWPRSRPTSASGTPSAAARISAPARPQ